MYQKDPIKVADVERALKAKGAEKPCPRCGTDAWHLDFVGIRLRPFQQQAAF
jgi:hypothetical protein